MIPVTTEKAVRLIELNNTLVFETDIRKKKLEIKKEIELAFGVKVDKVNTLTKLNKKYAYVKLNVKNPAIDIATKLGIM
ncbi:50S ribosomal protein L23 [Candidatus Pacearchaeota archaeon]|nr:50S ribosomal protein L23 [Candidatus Pacearchaeota archaeon]